MGQKDEKMVSQGKKRKGKCKHPCVVLQPQAHLYCMHVYMCVHGEEGGWGIGWLHAVWLCGGV